MKKSDYYQLISTLWLIVLLSSHWMGNDWLSIIAQVCFIIALIGNIILAISYSIKDK